MTGPGVDQNTDRDFDEVFEHFLVESGCLPADTVAAASQARWRRPHWLGTVALSSRTLTVGEAAAALQWEAKLGESFGVCAHNLGFLTLQQIAELTLRAYWQRRSLSECLVADHAIDVRGLAELRQILKRAVSQATEPITRPSRKTPAFS